MFCLFIEWQLLSFPLVLGGDCIEEPRTGAAMTNGIMASPESIALYTLAPVFFLILTSLITVGVCRERWYRKQLRKAKQGQ